MTDILTYNDVSVNYNERYAQNNLGGIESALIGKINECGAARILEMGCGTGRWLTSLSMLNKKLYGLDLSFGMLSQIRQRNITIDLINAGADVLPLKKKSLDFIYCVNAIHHFADPRKFISNVKNLLTPGGYFIIIGIDPRNPNDCWYAYDYFKGIKEFDFARIPSFDNLISWSNFSGFKNVVKTSAEIVTANWKGSTVFNDVFLQKHNSSQLMQLSEEEYNLGIMRMKETIMKKPENLFRTHLTFDMLSMQAG